MNNRTGLAGLGLIGLVLAVLVTRGPEAPAPLLAPPRLASDSTIDRLARTGYKGAELLREFFHGPIPKGITPEILIATVPDPYDSHLDQQYDLYVESLRRAFEAAGYVLDRFWLAGRADSGNSKVAAFDDSIVTRSTREIRPGVVLFRAPPLSGDSLPRVGLLYLVGEIPTGGVHKDALTAALAERDELLQNDSVIPLQLVGPAFSGSAHSLKTVLEQWLAANGRRSARVITGAATSPDNAQVLRAHPRLSFAATIHDDATLQIVFDQVVRKRLDLERIAFLHESTTGYGTAIGSTVLQESTAGTPKDSTVSSADTVQHGVVLRVPFPLNIATVRAEFARNPEARSAAKAPDRPLPARRGDRLPLQLQDAARPRESPGVVSVLTAPTLELVLDQIVQTLRAHEVEAVGLLATDVRDKLFLGELIRSRLPDVQLFTFESNALYLRRDYAPSLGGMLVLSTYPLWPEGQKWSDPSAVEGSHKVLQFASDGAQGVYNAAAIFLSGPTVEYRSPIGSTNALVGTAPPVWVSAVGTRSFVPLVICGVRSGATDSARTPYLAQESSASIYQATIPKGLPDSVSCGGFHTESRTEDFHNISFLGWLSGILLALILGWGSVNYLMWRRADENVQAHTVNTEPPDRRQIETASLWTHMHLYALLRLIALASMFLPVVTIMARGGLHFQSHSRLETMLGSISIALLVALLFGLSTGRVRWRYWTWLLLPIALWLGGQIEHFGRYHNLPPSRQEFEHSASILWAIVLVLALIWLAAVKRAAFAVAAYIRRDRSLLLRYLFPDSGGARHPRRSSTRREPLSAKTRRRRFAWIFETAARGSVGLMGILYFVLIIGFVITIHQLGDTHDLRFVQYFHRAVQLDSGLSPMLPVVLAGAGFAAWSIWHSKRVELLIDSTAFEQAMTYEQDSWATSMPESRWVGPNAEKLSEYVFDLRNRLFFLVPNLRGAIMLGLLTVLMMWLGWQFNPTIERLSFQLTSSGWIAQMLSKSFDWLLFASIMGTFGATAWAIYRLVSIWRGLGGVLNAVADTPLFSAFERVPRRLSMFSKPSLVRNPSLAAVGVTADLQWQHLRRIYDEYCNEIENEIAEETRRTERTAVPSLSRLMKRSVHWQLAPGRRIERLGRRLGDLNAVLYLLWDTEPSRSEIEKQLEKLEAVPDKTSERKNTSDEFRRRFSGPVGLWMKVAEEFTAVQAVAYIEWVQQHLRTLAFFILLSLLLTTALLSSYAFQPQALIRLLFVFVTIGAVASILFVMTEMNRNAVLSKINNTTAGEISWDATFIANVALYAVLPLLTLLSAEFPGLREVMFVWVDPLLKSFTKF